MAVLLHVSDLHFGTELPEVVTALQRLHADLAPDLVVASGDITQRATRRQFDEARRFFGTLAPRHLLLLPGNHDVPLVNVALRLVDPYRRWRAAFGEVLEPVHENDDLLVIGVNTVRPRWHKDGAVSPSQIAAVTRRLIASRPDQLRVVVTHQPAEVIRPGDRPDRLVRAEEALRAWIAAGADLILGGHIHLPYVVSLADRYPEIGRQAWLAQAGTAVSHRTRSGIPNSVNLIHTTGVALTIERFDYDDGAGRFRSGQQYCVRLDRAD